MSDRPDRAASDFPVLIGSELLGEVVALASRVSATGMLARRCAQVVPIGSVVTVHFRGAGFEMIARAEVAYVRPDLGMSLRFLTWS